VSRADPDPQVRRHDGGGGLARGPSGHPARGEDRLPQVLIAGAGNSLLAGDRVGPMLLERVGERYGDDVELCDIGCTALALLDRLRGQELLVVVDACVGRGRPGEVFVVDHDLEALSTPGTSVHQIGPIEALMVARHLEPERLPARVVLLLVETGPVDEGVQESACVTAMNQLDREIDDWRRRRGRTVTAAR
jgi:hydrogenase maturation protease